MKRRVEAFLDRHRERGRARRGGRVKRGFSISVSYCTRLALVFYCIRVFLARYSEI